MYPLTTMILLRLLEILIMCYLWFILYLRMSSTSSFSTSKTSYSTSMIHVDIGSHPPIPLDQKYYFNSAFFSMIFQVLNFRGHFEALNDVFLGSQWIHCFQPWFNLNWKIAPFLSMESNRPFHKEFDFCWMGCFKLEMGTYTINARTI